MNDLVTTEPQASMPARQDLFSTGPVEMLAQASQIATVLKDVITKQKLTVRIGPNEYVKVEGWSTMGCMLGILPREKEVTELDDGSFLAVVELYSLKTGAIVGQGSALCGIDEKRWGAADRYARRSMAITRATGKAYRLGFSWIMSIAGYDPTPFEEMPQEEPRTATPPPPARRAASIYTGTEAQQKAVKAILVKEGVPEEFWEQIDNRLRGKLSTEIKNVIAAVRAGDPLEGTFSQ